MKWEQELSNPCANLTWKTPRNKSCLENHKRERKGNHTKQS
jgi:hypothetical protein